MIDEIFQAVKNSAVKIKDILVEDEIEYSQNQNATGDIQLKLDIKSDLIIEEELLKVESIREIASEEKESPKRVYESGEYLVGYDPLDGSSLADVNLSVGSIFGVYKGDYSGKNLVASVYVVYGPRVEMVIGYSGRVKLYRLNLKGEFNFIKDIELKKSGNLNAPGATQKNWYKKHKELIESIFDDGYRLRYSGGMVPDLHQILLKGGGLFSYPATTDLKKGKLRMVFEIFPFAHIFELAGGEAIDGISRVLDLNPSHIHDTSPCFFGSKDEIERVKKIYGE